MNDLHEDAGTVAEEIEQAESAEDAQLIGSTVTDIEDTVRRGAQVKEITVKFNSRNATIAVDLYSGALTAYRGMGDRHRVPLFEGDDRNTEHVLQEEIEFWEMQAREDGLEV